jgi:HPt (histidine-containing phosphotransfer) domain-containing protein
MVNFARLQEFRDYDDEALTMTREVIALFLADAPLRLDAIGRALAAADRQGLIEAAHALKGSAGNVGAGAIQRSATELEESAAQGIPANADALLSQLRTQWNETKTAISGWAATL